MENKDILAVIAAAGGWVVAIITLVFGYLERKSAREEDLLTKTIAYFDGGGQRRSIGVSLLEGVWIDRASYHKVIVPLVANQIVYLLLSSESVDAHNERNLVRLIMLLRKVPHLQHSFSDRWTDVCDAIYQKVCAIDEGDKSRKGIPISRATLRLWSKELGHDVGPVPPSAGDLDLT